MFLLIKGNPPPAIKWMKESENGNLIEILDDDQYDITEKDINVKEFILSTLLVKKVEFVGFDNYVCRGDNSHGRAEASIRLNSKFDIFAQMRDVHGIYICFVVCLIKKEERIGNKRMQN